MRRGREASGGNRVKNPSPSAGAYEFDPLSRSIPHASGRRARLGTAEPVFGAQALQQGKLGAASRSRPLSTTAEEPAQRWRPNSQKIKKNGKWGVLRVTAVCSTTNDWANFRGCFQERACKPPFAHITSELHIFVTKCSDTSYSADS